MSPIEPKHQLRARRLRKAAALLATLLIGSINIPAHGQNAATPSAKIKISETPERSAGSYLDELKFNRETKTIIPRQSASIDDEPQPETSSAPPLNNTIEGINFDENAGVNGGIYFIPPDPIGAAGPSHVLSVTNCSIEWFTKAGVNQKSSSLSSFFSGLVPLTATFDPKVIYDQYAGRFVVITLERTDVAAGAASNTSRILVAVSDNSNPNGTWFFHAINAMTSISATDYWADYPGLAVDDKAIYVTSNLFSFGAGVFGGARLWIIHKTPYYSGGAATVTVHDPSTAVGQAATTTQPAHMFGAAPAGVGSFLVRYSGYTDGVNEYLSIIRLDDPLTSPTFSHQFVLLGDIDATIFGIPDAPQNGTLELIDTGDRRALHAVWRNDALWTTMTILPGSGEDAFEATAHWTKVNTTTLAALALADQGNIGGDEITPDAYTYYPSIAVDGGGNAGIGFALSGAGNFPGAYYTARLADNLPGVVQPINVLRQGQDYYLRMFGGSRNRWGDYSGISVDPSDDATFWVFNEYALSRGTILGGFPTQDGRWGTAFGSFTFSSLPSAPARQWSARHNGTGDTEDVALAIALADANSGNVYVAGYSNNAGANTDFLLIKYNGAGAKLWAARYNGPANGDDEANAVCVDPEGNVYAAGHSRNFGGNLDGLVIKYNSAGKRQWVARHNGSFHGDDAFHDIECDIAGNLFVTGYTTTAIAGRNLTTVKYSSGGAKIWLSHDDGAGHSDDAANELALDGDGNVYVTGYTTNAAGNTDFTTVKYNSTGTRMWKRNFNAPANFNDVATDIGLDALHNVYVAGYSRNAGENDDYLVIKYSTHGTRLWSARYNGPGSDEDRANDVAVDESGNVYLTGHSYNAAGNVDYATIKYNAAGVRQWVARYNGPSAGADGANRVLVDGSGNVFVTGSSFGGVEDDFATVNYNSAGKQQWVLRQNGFANGPDVAHDMALDAAGNLIVTGASANTSGNLDYFTVSYAPLIPGALKAAPEQDARIAAQANVPTPASFSVHQNYPNPFNPVTSIRYHLAESVPVRIEIFDQLGRRIRTLVNGETLQPGDHSVLWDGQDDAGRTASTGIYLYKVTAGAEFLTKKMILQK